MTVERASAPRLQLPARGRKGAIARDLDTAPPGLRKSLARRLRGCSVRALGFEREIVRGAGCELVRALRFALILGAALTLAVLPACGGAQPAPRAEDGAARNTGSAGSTDPQVADPRAPIEQRRDAACEQLGPRLTACAVEDARADLAAGKITQDQFSRDTAPEVQRKNTEEFERACKSSHFSSRQVRVLEVCFRDEAACAPLLACLAHLNDGPERGGK